MSANQTVFPIILAGGRSSRLFPFNKVLSDLTGSGRSLIQQAMDRLGTKEIYVLTVQDMIAPIQKQLGLPKSRFFADPERRGTWPAILWAMAYLRRENPTAVMAVVTGDHVIPNVKEFRKALQQAIEIASKHPVFVVIPVTPSSQAEEWMGFGALKSDGAGRINGFVEKPSLASAREMITAGGWFWNAGMFIFRIPIAEKVLQIYHPQMYALYSQLVDAVAQGKISDAARLFAAFPEKITHPLDPSRQVDNTVDYAVMMPLVHRPMAETGAFATRQVLTEWADLGQWTALRQVAKPDRLGNVLIGDVRVGSNVRNSILVTERGHRIEVSGVKDLIVALSGGKALVLPTSDVGRVKEIVSAAKGKQRIIGQMPYITSFALGKRRNVVILTNKRKEAI